MKRLVLGIALLVGGLGNSQATGDRVPGVDQGIDAPVWINGAY